MPTVRQASLLGGELAPEFYGRTDSPYYAVGARKILNFLVRPSGALVNRTGSKLVAKVKDSTAKPKLIPFVFSTTQTYILEFGFTAGAGYIRFFQNGAPVMSGGVPYEVAATPWLQAMLPYLKWAQSGDVLTVCYGGQDIVASALAPQELKRFGHTDWTVTPFSVAVTPVNFSTLPKLQTPAPIPDATHGGSQWDWRLTQLWRENTTGNVIEAFTGGGGVLSQTAVYNGATTYAAGDLTLASDGSGNSIIYTSLVGANTGNTPSTSPTFWARGVSMGSDRTLKIGWVDGTLAGYTLAGHNIYRGRPRSPTLSDGPTTFGFVGFAEGSATQFLDGGDAPDYTRQPPIGTDPFAAPAGDYPSCVGFFEQRRIFARQGLHPSRIQGSRIGKISNFDVDLFVQADDAISFDLSSLTLDEIRSMVPLQSIFVLTQSGVWTVRGFSGTALGPTSVNARKQHDAAGASWVTPARANNALIYEQDGGGAVWDFTYNYFYDVGQPRDISVHASHLFEGHTLVALAYQARPRKTLWAVRDDGLLIGCTYVTDQQNPQNSGLAWHQHSTDGTYEDVVVVQEGFEDAVYVLVNRTISGQTQRTVERFATRLVTDARLGVFLDAALSFDGRNTGAVTMKATTNGATYNGGDEMTVLASAPTFVPDDVGSAIVLDPDATAGGPFRMTILAYTDATHVTAILDANLAAAFQNITTVSWAFARRRFSGLGHLEAKTVAALADGAVATAAKQDSSLIVTAGQITIDTPSVIVHAGLPYVSDLELLDLPTAKLNVKSITRAALEVVGSRGLWAGETFDKLKEWRQRGVKDAWGNPPLAAGIADVPINASWNTGGRAVFRQIDPLPLTIVAAIREVVLGGN